MAYELVDPESVLSWSHDWSDWLGEGDEIVSNLWTITQENEGSPTTPTLANATTDTVLVSGLIAGRIYHLTERVTTTAGLTDERTITLRCDHR